MAMMNSIRGFPVNMNFAPIPGVTPLGPEAFLTPQEKAMQDKQQRGGLIDQALNSIAGPGNIRQTPPAAGGVPGQGGGAAPTTGVDPLAPLPEGAAQAAQGSGGIMSSIMKFLPMLMGMPG